MLKIIVTLGWLVAATHKYIGGIFIRNFQRKYFLMFMGFKKVFPNFVRKILFNKYQNSASPTLFTQQNRIPWQKDSNYFVVRCLETMFLRHILYWKQTHVFNVFNAEERQSVAIRPSACAIVAFFLYTLKGLCSAFLHRTDVI